MLLEPGLAFCLSLVPSGLKCVLALSERIPINKQTNKGLKIGACSDPQPHPPTFFQTLRFWYQELSHIQKALCIVKTTSIFTGFCIRINYTGINIKFTVNSLLH